MVMTYYRLQSLLSQGVIQGAKPDSVNGASIDVHLGDTFFVEDMPEPTKLKFIDVQARESPAWKTVKASTGTFTMRPGQFILASTKEVFNLPDDICALFVMKSSVARCGLDQMNAAWCSPGWRGSALTLELINVTRGHALVLRPGMPIGQMVFFEGDTVPAHVLYSHRGAYNNHPEVHAVTKPI